MNGFGLHVIPMVGLILLSWLGLLSLGMERGAPPAAPGWPSGCTFPEVELPGGQSSQANRAFCGCEQLQRFTLLDWGDIEQWVQAEHNAFFMCDKFEKPHWLELLPAEGPDSDAFDEELYHVYP